MSIPFEDIFNKFSLERQKKIKQRADELMKEYNMKQAIIEIIEKNSIGDRFYLNGTIHDLINELQNMLNSVPDEHKLAAYFNYSYNGSTGADATDVEFWYCRTETDEEYASRLVEQAYTKKGKSKLEEFERNEYERLKKKFES